jgi:RimJ/RimL family protein N-acetyltransferase
MLSSKQQALENKILVDQATSLVPVGPWITGEESLVELMVAWRTSAKEMFFAQINPTPASMKTYLSNNAIGKDDRILFMVQFQEQFVGHIGLSGISAGVAHIDQVMKSPNPQLELPKGIMSKSFAALTEWGNSQLGISKYVLEVVSSNKNAIRFYQRLGFEILLSEPLTEFYENKTKYLRPPNDGDFVIATRKLHMEKLFAQ